MASSTCRLRIPSSNSRSSKRSRVRWEVMPIPVFHRSSRIALYPQLAQPAIQMVEHFVVGLVDAQRRDRDIALHHRVEIGSFATVLGITGDGNPVTFLAARIGPLD